MLGSVRDLDILCQRLHSAAAHIAGNGRVSASTSKTCQDDRLEPLFLALRERHAQNSRALHNALQGERYRDLLATLDVSIERPVLEDDAREPCRTALPPLAVGAWRRLRRGARALKPTDPDVDFHDVRKRAKRARYTAELIAPALGRRAEKHAQRFIRLTTQLQDILGEHQDAIVAMTEVERFIAERPQDQGLARAARELLETQHRAAQVSREKFFDIWKKLERKKSLRWLKGREKART
jgi:CHAD domain-containing protein